MTSGLDMARERSPKRASIWLTSDSITEGRGYRRSHRGGVRAPASSDVAVDVDDRAVGVAHEEAPDAPRLVGERVDDRQAAAHRLGVRGVDVRDLDRDLRAAELHVGALPAARGHRDLRGPVARRGEHREALL